MSLADLTPRQRDVYRYIERTIRKRNYAPTVREICEHFGWTSPLAARCHLQSLEKKGVIRRKPRLSRAIVLVNSEKPRIPLFDSTEQLTRLLKA